LWKEAIRGKMEQDLSRHPAVPFGLHDGAPFGILCYPPEAEFELREEVERLKTRLRNDRGKGSVSFSLAKALFTILGKEASIEEWAEMERTSGLEQVLQSASNILRQGDALVDMVVEQANTLDADRSVLFLTHTGALFPGIRTSGLVGRLEGRVRVPTILLYPGTRKGEYGLSFMGKLEPEHNYRAVIYGGEA
jgi:hypothetical protein